MSKRHGSMSEQYEATRQTTATRHRDRISYDRTAVHAVLDEALTCHVGYVFDGRPVVLPQLHVRVGEELFLHGSTGARAMRESADGLALCVTVTLVDALVLARSAFHHSINYRSVVIHAIARQVTNETDKQAALSALVESVMPGRSAAVRGPSRRELAATSLLRLDLRSVSLKTRTGPPADDASDLELPYWAGVLPLAMMAGEPEPAPDLQPGLLTPAHVSSWTKPA